MTVRNQNCVHEEIKSRLVEKYRRPRRRWEDNIINDLREIGREDVDWIHLAHMNQW
jgi:hypothetical protein